MISLIAENERGDRIDFQRIRTTPYTRWMELPLWRLQ